MADLAQELEDLAGTLLDTAKRGDDPGFAEPLDKLADAAQKVAKAWSGSPIGYHSRIYYQGLVPPPPGTHFSAEWGLQETFSPGTNGDWVEYAYDDIVALIRENAGSPGLSAVERTSAEMRRSFAAAQATAISILTSALGQHSDELLAGYKQEVETVPVATQQMAMRVQLPTGQIMSRDSLAMSQGVMSAPHQEVLAEVFALRSPVRACRNLAEVASKAAAHLNRIKPVAANAVTPPGTGVFIGHGQSPLWRELKDFVHDRLALPWDEFNRVPIAGYANVARLEEMLDFAGIAFLVLTAEDEISGGSKVARQNVIHEAGLFQGRLGFTRAIVLLEDGCEEFSNIHGLGQIRFPPGQISAAFEEIRRVFEREGFL